MDKIRNFKQLKIWQKGIEIVKDIYMITKHFPKQEIYGLSIQMRRSAVSIPTNIAEGFKRYHSKEFHQFLHIALGSAAELETQLIITVELKYVKCEKVESTVNKLEHLSKMITALKRKLK